MTHLPLSRRPARFADAQLHAIGLLALAIVLVAATAAILCLRALPASTPPLWDGDRVGATLAVAGADTVVVDSLRSDGAAIRGGMRVGDVIEAVDGAAVSNVTATARALRNHRVDIRIRRGKMTLDLHVDATGGLPFGQQDPADRG